MLIFSYASCMRFLILAYWQAARVEVVQSGSLVCNSTLPVKSPLPVLSPCCFLASSGLGMTNCFLGSFSMIRNYYVVICCLPPILVTLRQGSHVFSLFTYLHGYILPSCCGSRNGNSISNALWPCGHPPVIRVWSSDKPSVIWPYQSRGLLLSALRSSVFNSFAALSCSLVLFFYSSPCRFYFVAAFTLLLINFYRS